MPPLWPTKAGLPFETQSNELTRACHRLENMETDCVEKSSPELRAELSRLTHPAEDAELEWLDFQIREIAALNEWHPHSVALHTPSTDATAKMNCFTYALDIDPDAISDMCLGKVFPGSEFVSTLMRSALCATDGAETGGIVLYLDSANLPRHAGKIGGGGRIISKWGACRTHIWEHGLWEVPIEYGDEARFFECPTPGMAAQCYLTWAKAKGL